MTPMNVEELLTEFEAKCYARKVDYALREKLLDLLEIASLTLACKPYGCFIGEWDQEQAAKWKAESEVLKSALFAVIDRVAKKNGIEYKHFAEKR